MTKLMRSMGWICAFMVVSTVNAASAAPDVLVKETTGKIVDLLQKNRAAYNKDHKKLYAMVHEHILPHFDFTAMSRSVLGRYWRDANEAQRAKFVDAFRDLLVRTYSTALLKYTNEEILFLPYHGRPDDPTVTVRTEVKAVGGGPNIPMNYSFYNKRGDWKIYDVSVDGVSIVTNYQTTYAAKIQKEGMDALIASITQDNRADVAGASAKKK